MAREMQWVAGTVSIDCLSNSALNAQGAVTEYRQGTYMTELRILPVLFLLSCFAHLNGQPTQAHDDAGIRRQIAGYAEARTQGSGEKQASFYAEDGDEWELFASEKTNGRSAIAKLLDLPPDPNRRFRLEILHITRLGRDAALVDAHWYRETSPRPKGRVHYSMVKKHDTWLIQSARINPYPQSNR
jgi:hypothetical protein